MAVSVVNHYWTPILKFCKRCPLGEQVAQADAARQAAAAQAEAEDLDMAALHERLNSVRM